MTILEQRPLTLSVPLREEPPGVLRVGKSRVLLELVIHAYHQGESPEGIVDMYRGLELADVFAVIAYYLAYVWGGRALRAVAPRSDSANFPGFFSILCSVFRDSVVTIFRVIS